MAGAVNEVDEVIRNWTADNPTVVGYVVINADGECTPRAQRLLLAYEPYYTGCLTEGFTRMGASLGYLLLQPSDTSRTGP